MSLSYYFTDLESINNFGEGFWKVNKTLLEERLWSVFMEVINGDMSDSYWSSDWFK